MQTSIWTERCILPLLEVFVPTTMHFNLDLKTKLLLHKHATHFWPLWFGGKQTINKTQHFIGTIQWKVPFFTMLRYHQLLAQRETVMFKNPVLIFYRTLDLLSWGSHLPQMCFHSFLHRKPLSQRAVLSSLFFRVLIYYVWHSYNTSIYTIVIKINKSISL